MNMNARPTKAIPYQKSAVTQAVDLTIRTAAPKDPPPTAVDATASEFCVQSVRARIASYVADGTHSLEVINALYNGSTFLPQCYDPR